VIQGTTQHDCSGGRLKDESKWASQLRRGAIELAVLTALRHEELYAYDVVRRLREHPVLRLEEGTLYPLVSRMRAAGWLRSRLEPSNSGPPRRVYALTDAGEQHLEHMEETWQELVQSMDRIRRMGA
jgi:PadR family transcriptional regulator PadR